MPRLLTVGWLCVIVAGCLHAATKHKPDPAAHNLVSNGSFELQRPDATAAGWTWSIAKSAQAGVVVDRDARFGRASVRLSNGSESAPNRYGTLFTIVPVRPNTAYWVSVHARGRSVADSWFGGGRGWSTRKYFPRGDFAWQRFRLLYVTAEGETRFTLRINVDGPTSGLWIDGVQMTEVPGPREFTEPGVTAMLAFRDSAGAAGPVFASHTSIAARVAVHNHFSHRITVPLRLETRNAEGVLGTATTITLDARAQATTGLESALGRFEPGFYASRILYEDRVLAETTFVVSRKQRPAPGVPTAFGVNVHLIRTDEKARLLQWLGIQRVRGDAFNLDEASATDGWRTAERELELVDRYKLDYLAILFQSSAALRRGADDFLHRAVDAVTRFQGRVHAWEVWNEPNLRHYFEGTASDYAALLARAYRAIRKTDQDVPIVMGGLAGLPDEYLARIQREAPAEFDAINLHPYRHPEAPEVAPALDVQLAKFRSTKPLWLTEIGYFMAPFDEPFVVRPTTELDESRFLVRSLTMARAAGAQRIYWYQLQGGSFGLLRSTGEPRASFASLAVINELLGDARTVVQLQAASSTRIYCANKITEQVLVAWAPTTTTDIRISVAAAALLECVDTWGTTAPSRCELLDGALHLRLSPSPIFVRLHGATLC